jgi:hypothetical protein
MLARLILSVGIFIITPWTTSAQFTVQPGSTTPVIGKDTLCFAYRFIAGDTAFFLTEAIDSVIFPGKPTLLKTRTEENIFVCDSVVDDTVFYLRTWLRAAHERQTTPGSGDTVDRVTFPWVNRVTFITMTQQGKRLTVVSALPNRAATSPGGVFRPLELPPLGGDCARQYQSWQHLDTVVYTENAIPDGIAFTNALFRVLDFVDSNMIRYRQIQYTQSSIASYEPQQAGIGFTIRAVINSYGKMTFDPGRLLPIHHAATSEQKLTIKREGHKDEEGKHLLLQHTRLVELRSSDATRRMQRLPDAVVRRPR